MSQEIQSIPQNVGKSLNWLLTALTKIKGDGSCLFFTICCRATGSETAQLKFRNARYDYTAETNRYAGIKRSTTKDIDLELMATAKVLGIDIFV